MKTLILSLFFTMGTWAASPAYDVAKKLSDANEGFVGESGNMEMQLISGKSKTTRKMISKSREGKVEDKTLLEFVLPKDVAGTKLLTWSYDDKDDQQWIYLPALRRVKRITSSGKTSSFMGSEFTFEDLRAPALEKYTYEDLKDTADQWQYLRKSKEKSGYSKQIIFASKKYMSATKIEFYDRSGELLKVATYEGFKQFQVGKKKFWRPATITMENKQNQKISIIAWKDRKIGEKISSNTFTKRALK